MENNRRILSFLAVAHHFPIALDGPLKLKRIPATRKAFRAPFSSKIQQNPRPTHPAKSAIHHTSTANAYYPAVLAISSLLNSPLPASDRLLYWKCLPFNKIGGRVSSRPE